MPQPPGLDLILSEAANEAVAGGFPAITPGHLLIALARASEAPPSDATGITIRREFEELGIEPRRFRRRLRGVFGSGGTQYRGGVIGLSAACRAVIAGVDDGSSGGTWEVGTLVPAAFAWLVTGSNDDADAARARAAAADPPEAGRRPSTLGELTRRLRALRDTLLAQVHGQDHAVQQFVEGLFNVEVTHGLDSDRRGPSGLFVFAGPPGVGKTYLAELGAQGLDRPFKRFDMSAFGHAFEGASLTGVARMFQGAQPGSLTTFVRDHPQAVLLFDEIEKAHPTTIHLFLQILDAGRLQDRYTEEDIDFRGTIVIFTTNVGRKLYEDENASGIRQAHSLFHRQSVLDALSAELNPQTREPYFPAAICSRLATGHPLLFNHLRVHELALIAAEELARTGALLERRYQQRYSTADEIPLALVMREGAGTDARTIKARAEAFLKDEVFKTCQLFADGRVDTAFAAMREVTVEIDDADGGELVQQLLREQRRACVLLVAGPQHTRCFEPAIGGLELLTASTADQLFDCLARTTPDFVLLDLGIEEGAPQPYPDAAAAFHDVSAMPAAGATMRHFDFRPLSARQFAFGQRLLQLIHARTPDVPVYLLATDDAADPGGLAQLGVDKELLLACVRAGGARGVVRAAVGADGNLAETARGALVAEIDRIAKRLRTERTALELARQSQVVSFDTAPLLSPDGGHLRVRCRNFRRVRAVRSMDAGALVADVERPTVRFSDVFGAASAKDALGFIGQWLRDPKRFAAAGVEAPRGILLTGAPGAGKTLLARALAGESDCSFLAVAATSFVTKFQGSGPEAVREIFARARRYAPSVVFIDEIDAIGASRGDTRAGLAGHGEALALNQLLVEMDGFARIDSRPVVVIAATNHPEKLDAALIRRFGRVIEVELPTRPERAAYLRSRLDAKARHDVGDELLDRLAIQSQGMSIADLERVMAEAGVLALKLSGVIDDGILNEAFERLTFGEERAGVDPLRTARHEAGHAVVMCELGSPPVYTTIVGRGRFGGYAALDTREEWRSQTKQEFDDLICQLLGGREAERLCYGGGWGDSTGPASDLEQATRIAESMVCDFGMSVDLGFVKIDRQASLTGPIAERCHQAVRTIIEAQTRRAAEILTLQRHRLDSVTEALVDRGRLLRSELLAIIEDSDSTGNRGTEP